MEKEVNDIAIFIFGAGDFKPADTIYNDILYKGKSVDLDQYDDAAIDYSSLDKYDFAFVYIESAKYNKNELNKLLEALRTSKCKVYTMLNGTDFNLAKEEYGDFVLNYCPNVEFLKAESNSRDAFINMVVYFCCLHCGPFASMIEIEYTDFEELFLFCKRIAIRRCEGEVVIDSDSNVDSIVLSLMDFLDGLGDSAHSLLIDICMGDALSLFEVNEVIGVFEGKMVKNDNILFRASFDLKRPSGYLGVTIVVGLD